MIIDLKAYGTELAFWIDAFAPYVDRASATALKQILSDLQRGQDETDVFPWNTPKPIKTRVANSYDGQDKAAMPVFVTWSFNARFSKIAGLGKRPQLWNIDRLETHIKIIVATDDQPEALHFHNDLKNHGQLGPHTHLQIAESFLQQKKQINLAVPRFPTATVLPTDCLDLVLSEFFPHEWPQSQADARGIDQLRTRQRKRIVDFATQLEKHWEHQKKTTPVAVTQDAYLANFQIA